MSNPIVEELERRFLPPVEAMAERLRRHFPNVRVNTWSSPIGSATTYQGHDLGIDCLFAHAPPDQTDNVALYIGVTHINSDPHLCDLSVCWGAGASVDCIGADLLESPVPWSADAISRIEAALPTLFEVLIAALRNPPFPNEAADPIR